MEAPPGLTVVAVEHDDDGSEVVLGSAKTGPNRPGRGAHVATASFMVDPACAGRGVGRALGAFVLESARAQGYRSMQFNAVVESNLAAVALWRSLGVRGVGTLPRALRPPPAGAVGVPGV